MGRTVSYPRLINTDKYHLSILVLSDAARTGENGQLEIIMSFLVGDMERNDIYHPLSWISQK